MEKDYVAPEGIVYKFWNMAVGEKTTYTYVKVNLIRVNSYKAVVCLIEEYIEIGILT